MFNWLTLVQLIPAVILGVQQIHANSTGATKKQVVLEYIGLGESAAAAVDPALAPTLTAVNSLIDNFVSLFHAQNAPGFGTNSSATK